MHKAVHRSFNQILPIIPLTAFALIVSIGVAEAQSRSSGPNMPGGGRDFTPGGPRGGDSGGGLRGLGGVGIGIPLDIFRPGPRRIPETQSENGRRPYPRPDRETSDNPKRPRPGKATTGNTAGSNCPGQGSGPVLRRGGRGCPPVATDPRPSGPSCAGGTILRRGVCVPVDVADPAPPRPTCPNGTRPGRRGCQPIDVADPVPPRPCPDGTVRRPGKRGCLPVDVADPVPPRPLCPDGSRPRPGQRSCPPANVADPVPPRFPPAVPPVIVVDPVRPIPPLAAPPDAAVPLPPSRQASPPAAPPARPIRTGNAPLPPRRALTAATQLEFRPSELLVMVQGAEPDTVAAQLAQNFNIVVEESQSFELLQDRRVYRFSIPDNRAVDTVVAAVANSPGVELSLPNFYHYLQAGSAAGKQALNMQYALPKLRVPETLNFAGGRGVTVAVIDSGVDLKHPVLRQSNIAFFDAVDGAVKGPDQHGTAIAGIIAGRGEVSGVAPGVKIFAARAFAPERLGLAPVTTSMTLARATDTAFARGARVFNMSFAGPRDPLLLSIIESAYGKGSVFIAAAGNRGPKAPPAYPAAYEKVIAITATDEGDALYSDANRGAYVSVAAPGVDILAPVTNDGLDYLSGTSFAAAHITGIVALLMERNPQLAPDQIRDILLGAAHDLGETGHDEEFGAGLADAYRALLLATPPSMQSSVNR